MRYVNFLIPAGASDELVVDFAATAPARAADPAWVPTIYALWLSAETSTFDWTLFFAEQAAEPVPANTVIMDSMEAIPATVVAPVAINVVNRAIICPGGYQVPRGVSEPMSLRVSTANFAVVGRIRLHWDWRRPT
jgi:hypothetical protein